MPRFSREKTVFTCRITAPRDNYYTLIIHSRFPKGSLLFFAISKILPPGSIFGYHPAANIIFRSLSQVDAQEFLRQNAYDKGHHRNTNADQRHLRKPGFEGLVLSDAGIVGKARDDQDDHSQHTDQRRDILGHGEDQIGRDQGNHRQ